MQIEDINKEIERLMKDNSHESCQKLASLYIVRDHLQRTETAQNELFDILPTYSSYVDIKRKYQLGNAGEKAVEIALKNLCQEIYEFFIALYSATNSCSERQHLQALLEKLKKFFKMG